MGFTPPPYPYDRLDPMKAKAAALDGGVVDLSIGTPNDPPPKLVLDALATSNTERGYPASIGSPALRAAAVEWMGAQLGVDVPAQQVAACVGTKEFVASVPQFLQLRTPERDTVLYPAISYPTYEMGAILAGCRAVAVPVDAPFVSSWWSPAYKANSERKKRISSSAESPTAVPTDARLSRLCSVICPCSLS